MAPTACYVKSTRWDLIVFYSDESHRVDFDDNFLQNIGLNVAIHLIFMSFTEVIRSPSAGYERVCCAFSAQRALASLKVVAVVFFLFF